MQFVESSIADVKSIAQRALVLHWSRAAGSRPLPRFEDFETPSRGHDPNLMAIWRVEPSVGGQIFRAEFQGDHVAAGFHKRWEGRDMADMVPAFLRAPSLEGARFCVENRQAVYMIFTAHDTEGKRIDCERLLLPFGSPDGYVRKFLVSLEMVSMNRHVALSDALVHFQRAYEITFAGCFAPLPRGHTSLDAPRSGIADVSLI